MTDLHGPWARWPALLAAGFCVLALASCGGGSGKASSRLIVPGPATTKSYSAAEREALTREAVAHCKRAVANARSIPASARAELEPVCNKMTNLVGPTAEDLRRIVCGEIANVSSGNAAEHERARQTCEREAS